MKGGALLLLYVALLQMAAAVFPEDSEPISISHGNYTKQYPAFVGHKPGRNNTQRHKLDIQLIMILNRTLYIAARRYCTKGPPDGRLWPGVTLEEMGCYENGILRHKGVLFARSTFSVLQRTAPDQRGRRAVLGIGLAQLVPSAQSHRLTRGPFPLMLHMK